MNRRERRARAEQIVSAARKQVGYRAFPERRSAFTDGTPYTGKPWNGVFIQRILSEAFDGEPEVNFVSTVTALGYFATRNRVYRKRLVVGDIVFYNFASDPNRWYEQPHIGVIVEVKPDGSFRAVEGETGPGTPQGSQLVDGVFIRDRQPFDVLGTVRPEPARTPTVASTEPARIRMQYFESNGKTVARTVETVQLALNRIRPALSFNRGKRDGAFRSGLGLYARESGFVENRGEVTAPVLRKLGTDTGLLELE